MAEAKKVRITLVKSPIGYNKKQKTIVLSLGLKKLNTSRELALTPTLQGMIDKVSHLLEIEDAE